jgi:hypothetical protein
LLFLKRGFDEDEQIEPATGMQVTLPIWRVGEALLYAARLARLFGGDPSITLKCKYVGLRGRRLYAHDSARNFFMRDYLSHDDHAELTTTANAHEIDDNLPEIVHPLLHPLYERFSLFELSRDFVRTELDRLRRNRF